MVDLAKVKHSVIAGEVDEVADMGKKAVDEGQNVKKILGVLDRDLSSSYDYYGGHGGCYWGSESSWFKGQGDDRRCVGGAKICR